MSALSEIILVILGLSILAIIALLIALLVSVRRRPHAANLTISDETRDVIASLYREVENGATVHAAIGLIEDLEGNPEALERLRAYPAIVQAACLNAQLNAAQRDLDVALAALSHTRETQPWYAEDHEKRVEHLQKEIGRLVAASTQAGSNKPPRLTVL